jgi:uncharacterized protein YeaC (DUF1315 family)
MRHSEPTSMTQSAKKRKIQAHMPFTSTHTHPADPMTLGSENQYLDPDLQKEKPRSLQY